MAIWSLVLGLASMIGICLTGVPAIILGIIALQEIRQSRSSLTGRRLAIGGIITGVLLGFLCAPVSIALLIPAVQQVRVAVEGVQGATQASTGQAIERFTLDNGLTVLLRPVRDAKQAAIVVLYAIGGDHDPEDHSGLGHLIEHIYITAATGQMPTRTADQFMQKYPAGWNAQTGDRFTVFATVFPKESLDGELQEAADRMGDLRITATDLDREKPRLIGEVENMFGGAPQLVAYNQARERVRSTPLGGRKGGRPAHVSALTLETVQDRWRRFYKPKNATLVVAGAIDSTNALEMITKHFASRLAGEPIPPAGRPGAPIIGEKPLEVAAKPFLPGAGSELCVAYPAPSSEDELYPAFLVLVGRLNARAQTLDATPNRFPLDYSPIFDPSTLFITIPLRTGETAEQAVLRVDNFLAAALKPSLTAVDRMVAKNRFGVELQTANLPDTAVAQNLYFLAFATGRRGMLGMNTTDYGKAIDGVTNEQLKQAAEVFSPKRRVAIVATPQ